MLCYYYKIYLNFVMIFIIVMLILPKRRGCLKIYAVISFQKFWYDCDANYFLILCSHFWKIILIRLWRYLFSLGFSGLNLRFQFSIYLGLRILTIFLKNKTIFLFLTRFFCWIYEFEGVKNKLFWTFFWWLKLPLYALIKSQDCRH